MRRVQPTAKKQGSPKKIIHLFIVGVILCLGGELEPFEILHGIALMCRQWGEAFSHFPQ